MKAWEIEITESATQMIPQILYKLFKKAFDTDHIVSRGKQKTIDNKILITRQV
jgi:hypothetical protein